MTEIELNEEQLAEIELRAIEAETGEWIRVDGGKHEADAGWRATRTLPSGRIVFWLPVSSLEWLHTEAVLLTDTVMVGDPIFVGMQ